MASKVLNHLLAGFVRLHVLHHAAKDTLCGIEMIEELRRHGYRIGPGTLYPILHSMEASGLIRYEYKVIKGKRRKNFRITAAGRKLLSQAQSKVRELAEEVLSKPKFRGEQQPART